MWLIALKAALFFCGTQFDQVNTSGSICASSISYAVDMAEYYAVDSTAEVRQKQIKHVFYQEMLRRTVSVCGSTMDSECIETVIDSYYQLYHTYMLGLSSSHKIVLWQI